MKRKLLFILVITTYLGVKAQVSLDSGLVGCYPFSGNANDYSGLGNNGVVNGATLTTDRFGNANSAYNFVGTSHQNITIPAFSNMVPNNELSISLWTQSGAYTSTCPVVLITDSAQNRLCACVEYTGGPYAIWDYGNFTGGGRMIITSGTYTTNWQHYVFMVSKSGNIKKIYLNGALLDSSTYNLDLIPKSYRNLAIGGSLDWSGGPLWWTGALDDVRIYNRALNGAEVKALYNALPTFGCSAVGINEVEKSDMLVYADDRGQIHINAGHSSLTGIAHVYNVLGQSVLQKNIAISTNNSTSIDISNQPKGLYMLVLTNGIQQFVWKLMW